MRLTGGAQRNVLDDLRLTGQLRIGIDLSGAGTGYNQITRCYISRTGGAGEGDGIHIHDGASFNWIGTDLGAGCVLEHNAGAGLRIGGLIPSQGNQVLGCTISGGSQRGNPGQAGMVLYNEAHDTVIGGEGVLTKNRITDNTVGVLIRTGARRTVLHNNSIANNQGAGVLVIEAPENLIGDPQPTGLDRSSNELTNNVPAIEIRGAGSTNCRVVANLIQYNLGGVVLTELAHACTIGPYNRIMDNTLHGLQVDAGAHSNRITRNRIEAHHSPDAAGLAFTRGAHQNVVEHNTIVNNRLGIRVDGPDTLANAIRGNSISANTGKGIALSNGGNRLQAPPVLTVYDDHAVYGTTTAPDGSSVEVFLDPADEGAEPLAAAGAFGGLVKVAVNPARLAGLAGHINGTVTDPEGNTSEFASLAPGGLVRLSRIAFTSTRDGNAEIYLLPGVSLPARRLTDHPAADHSPVFSPDGTRLAFVSERDGNPELYLMNADGSGLTRLTTHAAADYDPAWSPDGARLAFVSERDGNPELYLMNADGSGLTRLTTDPGTDRWPTFSADTRVAFASDRSGNFEIYVLPAGGGMVQQITSHPAADLQPVWSPDGLRLAFVSWRDGNAELYTLKPDGSELRRLTEHPAQDQHPTWPPQSDTVLFDSNRHEGFELHLVRSSGGGVVRLTVAAGDNTQPSSAPQ